MRQQATNATQSATALPGRPLAWHLGLLCAALLLPLLALGTVMLLGLAANERARHESLARDGARQVAVSLDRGLATLGAIAEVLATSDHLREGNLEAFRRRVLQLPRIAEADILLRDADGRVVMATGQAMRTTRDDGAEMLARLTGRPQVSGVLSSPETGWFGFAVIVAVPAAGGRHDLILSLLVPVGALNGLLARESLPEGTTATVTDRDGVILARSRNAAQHVGMRAERARLRTTNAGWGRGVDAEGAAVALAFTPTEVAGWTAWVAMPEATFAEPLRRSATAVALGGLSFAALAAALAIAFARRIARPISALAAVAGETEGVVPIGPVREVNALARALSAARAEAALHASAQHELRHTARLNEMGALAAALAHEINQPLTAAATNAEAALRLLGEAGGARSPDLQAAREAMREAAGQAVHAGRIVRGLRDFVSASDGARQPSDLNDLVRAALDLALPGARRGGLTVNLDLAPDLPPVTVDRVQIQQVVVNLVRNAVEAMENQPSRELGICTARPVPRLLRLEVVDTGHGVPAEVAERLFTPFVTTKPTGMGVGLSIARGIVEEHGGRLTCAQRPGGGSIFRVTLPVVDENKPAAESTADAA